MYSFSIIICRQHNTLLLFFNIETTESGTETTSTENEHTTTDMTTQSGQETTTMGSEQTTTTDGSECPTGCKGNCPQTEEGQGLFVCPTGFRRHPQNCNLFYQCTQNPNSLDYNIVVFSCPNSTVYNEEGIMCSEPEESDNCMQQRFRRFNMPDYMEKKSVVWKFENNWKREFRSLIDYIFNSITDSSKIYKTTVY